jgi:hypothetical protein
MSKPIEKKTYVVVADAVRARFFRVSPPRISFRGMPFR